MITLASSGYRITGNLNEGVGDKAVGSAQSGTFAIPTGALGQLGADVYLDDATAAQYCNTGNATAGAIVALYSGFYRYVQMLSTASAALVAGQACFWSSPLPGVKTVTTDITVANQGLVAGIILCSTWTKGNYWWVYAGGGLCYIKGASTITNKTAGNLATTFQTGPAASVDAYADAGSINTALLIKSVLGVWYDTPTDGGLKRIMMNTLPFNF